MVRYGPVVEVVQDKCGGEEDDGNEIENPRIPETAAWAVKWRLHAPVNHVDPVTEARPRRVNTVVSLIKLQCVDWEDEGVLEDGAEDHEDAGHHELVNSIELARARGGGARANVVEDIDNDKEEDDKEGHATGDHLELDCSWNYCEITRIKNVRWQQVGKNKKHISALGCGKADRSSRRCIDNLQVC